MPRSCIALGRALKDELVLRNVATFVDAPAKARPQMRPLTADQARTFFSTLEGDRMAPVYIAATATGMRQGELLGLRWADVDLDGSLLTVRHSLQRGTKELAQPKTEKSRRSVALPPTRISWLLRQLRDAPDTLRVDARYPNAKEPVSATLKEVRDQPDRLLFGADPKREPRTFRVALSRELGTKRGKNQGSFVNESKKQALDFYREIVQSIRAWSPSAPRLPEQSTDTSQVASPEPPIFSDEKREFGEASEPAG